MGQSVSLFLTRAAGILLAGLLLFAALGHAHAAAGDDSYGLKRFPGDNYDTVPAGAGIPAPPAPAGYTPAPSGAPAGYYPALNAGVTPEVTVSPPAQTQSYQPAPAQAPAYQAAPGYQPAPAASGPYGYRPEQGAPAPLAQGYGYRPEPGAAVAQPAPEAYGYKPLAPTAPAYPAPRLAEASPVRGDPYAYYQQNAGSGLHDNGDYVLGAGDKLHLNVFGETDLSGDFTIDGSGFVRLPLIGQLRAAGYTGQQLEQVIGSALAQGYLKSPRVAVEVATYRPFYIIGAVNRPGQYPYVDHMNALNAIALAGGFSPTAVESVIFVRREGSNQEVEVPADRTTQIRPGDVVKVHNTFFSEALGVLAPFSGVASTAATAAIIQ